MARSKLRFPKLTLLILAFVIFAASSCSSLSHKKESGYVDQELSEAQPSPLFEKLKDPSWYKVNQPLDTKKVALVNTQIYQALNFGEPLKTKVAVRNKDGIITAILDESTLKQLSGFLQLNTKTKHLYFNFGPEYGVLDTTLDDAKFARAFKKLEEIRSLHNLTPDEPFQFYYDTEARIRTKKGIPDIIENGKLVTYLKGKNLEQKYDRHSQSHRCATDLFWILFEMTAYERGADEVQTP